MENIRQFTAKGLRKLRAGKNVTLEEASKEIGIGKDTLSRYENNNCSMQLDVLEKILNYYRVPFNIFFKN